MEIKPCPFCGGESEVYTKGVAIVRYYAKCSVCQVQTDDEMGPEQAADVWNSRVEHPSEADKWLAEATNQREIAESLEEKLEKATAKCTGLIKQCDDLQKAVQQMRRMLTYSGKLQ